MQTATIGYIIIAGVAALFLALFQYIYKSKKRNSLYLTLAILRGISLFAVLLLLINPKFDAVTFYEEKPNLIVAIDDSESVKYLKQDGQAQAFLSTLIESEALKDRFNIQYYEFGSQYKALDTLRFEDKQTNISKVFDNHSEVYDNTTSPLVLITDGNQTYGKDYLYAATKIDQPIFPVILGDTITYTDLKIQQLNVNRYAYLKNQFPVEVIVSYKGKEEVSTALKIWSGSNLLYNKPLVLSPAKSSEIVTTNLLASAAGVKSYKVELTALSDEKNVVNNVKNFAVEVIDQKTNIALVYDRLHPDLGALKKAIESNEQRKVTLVKPKDYISQNKDYQLVVLYQPNNNFIPVLEEISTQKRNTFTIIGETTNIPLLNGSQSNFKQEITNQDEEFQPKLNINYNNFIVDNITFEDFPPLTSEFGELKFNVPHDVLLYKTVNGNDTEQSMLSTLESGDQKHAVLSGEGLWRWRAQSYLNSGSFLDFDNVVGKLVQYLSSNKKRNRLNVDYKSFYNGNDNLIVTAQYFNKNYEFDANASLLLDLNNETTNTLQTFPLLLNNNSYSIDLSGIAPGDYKFTLKHNQEPISVSGNFKVLEYNVEQQFLNADVQKLQDIAGKTNGTSYFIDNSADIIEDLINDKRFVAIQKSNKTVVPLIDWKYLLGLIALALSLEWFIRKYNGLI